MTVNLPAFTSNPPQIHHQKTTFCTPFLLKPPAKTSKRASKKKLKKRSLFGVGFGCLLGCGEAQGVGIFFEGEAEGFDDEVVIFALREAGDGDCADDAGAGDVDGEAAAVWGVVGVGEVVAVAEGAVGLFEHESDGVGWAVEASDDVGFALDPAGVVGGSAESGVEERLVGLAEAANVDHDGLLAGECELAEADTETPCDVIVEVGEEEFGFLTGDGGKVFCDRH